MKLHISLSLVFLLLRVFTCLGQVFNDVSVECRYGKNVPYEEALRKATEKAKSEAIALTCGTDVSSFSILRTTEKETRYTTKTISNGYAVVRVYDRRVYSRGNQIKVIISGEVVKSNIPMSVEVWNLSRMYTNDQRITFDVSFYRDSYLKVFWFDEETGEGGLLYPQDGTYDRKFEGDNRQIRFPMSDESQYFGMICPGIKTQEDKYNEWVRNGRVSAPYRNEWDMPKPRNAGGGKWVRKGSGESKSIEKNISLVFVTTQGNIPFNNRHVNEENFLTWWCGLPIAERALPVKKHVTLKM